MAKYALRCTLCNERFPSFEKYADHIVTAHKERLDLRMKPEIIRVD